MNFYNRYIKILNISNFNKINISFDKLEKTIDFGFDNLDKKMDKDFNDIKNLIIISNNTETDIY